MKSVAQVVKDIKKQEQDELKKPLAISHLQVKASTVVWVVGIFLLDLITAYIVWNVTGYVFYGIMWFVIGAGGLSWSEWLQHRVGNNYDQREIAKTGVIVSAGAVAIMALAAGAFLVLGRKDAWISVMFEVTSVGLFLFHMLQAYRYREVDDDYIERNSEARMTEKYNQETRRIERAKKILKQAQEISKLESQFVNEFGKDAKVALGLDEDERPANNPANKPANNTPPLRIPDGSTDPSKGLPTG